jgi:hypothetical protein
MKSLILTVLLALLPTTSAILTDNRPVTMSSVHPNWGYPSPASADNNFDTY